MKKTLTLSFLICLYFFTSSCNRNSHSQKKIQYFWVRSYFSGKAINDTVKFEERTTHIKNDSLYGVSYFMFNGYRHELRRYSNFHNSAMDNETVIFELDSLGIIFKSNISWRTKQRLCSNSDSMNRIFDQAISEALFLSEKENLKCTGSSNNRITLFK